ncbi:Mov34/MPN/PAD-1 family protein [Mesorhizobium sp. M1136]|uniref:Mov34/MPN/PAD-1 family protein n=1 Tax=Mesorhizobium sp. M1136 TaxID=2957059 RepID=UPI00333553AF
MTQVLVPKSVLDEIREHEKNWPGVRERGGLLLGYRKADAIQIDSATFPGSWDYATPTLFRRSEQGHRLRALREWVRSAQTIDWVGEWHTHPRGLAVPSFVDQRSWRRIVSHTRKPMAFLIFNDTQIYAGLQSPRVSLVRKLKLEEDNDVAKLFA